MNQTITINGVQYAAATCSICGARMYPADHLPEHEAQHAERAAEIAALYKPRNAPSVKQDKPCPPKQPRAGGAACACGKPAYYAKTKECMTCYQRRHYGHRAGMVGGRGHGAKRIGKHI